MNQYSEHLTRHCQTHSCFPTYNRDAHHGYSTCRECTKLNIFAQARVRPRFLYCTTLREAKPLLHWSSAHALFTYYFVSLVGLNRNTDRIEW